MPPLVRFPVRRSVTAGASVARSAAVRRLAVLRTALQRATTLPALGAAFLLGACADATAPAAPVPAGEFRVELRMPASTLLLDDRLGPLQVASVAVSVSPELPAFAACPPTGCPSVTPTGMPEAPVAVTPGETRAWARWTRLDALPDTLILRVGASAAVEGRTPLASGASPAARFAAAVGAVGTPGLVIVGTIGALTTFRVEVPGGFTLRVPVPVLGATEPDLTARGRRLVLLLDPGVWLADAATGRVHGSLSDVLAEPRVPTAPTSAAALAALQQRIAASVRLLPP